MTVQYLTVMSWLCRSLKRSEPLCLHFCHGNYDPPSTCGTGWAYEQTLAWWIFPVNRNPLPAPCPPDPRAEQAAKGALSGWSGETSCGSYPGLPVACPTLPQGPPVSFQAGGPGTRVSCCAPPVGLNKRVVVLAYRITSFLFVLV